MSAWSIPRWGRPAPVSSILTATTELPDGAPPVNGLIGFALGVGFGLGFGLGWVGGAVVCVGVGLGVVSGVAATFLWCPPEVATTTSTVTKATATAAAAAAQMPLRRLRRTPLTRPHHCRHHGPGVVMAFEVSDGSEVR